METNYQFALSIDTECSELEGVIDTGVLTFALGIVTNVEVFE